MKLINIKTLLILAFVFNQLGCSRHGLSEFEYNRYQEEKLETKKLVKALEEEMPEDRRLPMAYIKLGTFSNLDGSANKAEMFLKKALEASHRVKPYEPELTELALNNRGSFYLSQKKFDDAISYFKAVITHTSRKQAEKLKYTDAINLDNLAMAYSGKGEYGPAIRFGREALETLEKAPSYSSNTKTEAFILYNLASSLYETGNLSESNKLLSSAKTKMQTLVKEQPSEYWLLNKIEERCLAFSKESAFESNVEGVSWCK